MKKSHRNAVLKKAMPNVFNRFNAVKVFPITLCLIADINIPFKTSHPACAQNSAFVQKCSTSPSKTVQIKT
jgi:hypothetical protein